MTASPTETARPADPAPTGPFVCRLDDPGAENPDLTGSKAAALAVAGAAGLPIVPGFVVTTAATAAVDRAGGDLAALSDAVRAEWDDLTGGQPVPLAVRSSSTVEDLAGSSMAGRFESVVGVVGWPSFVEAVGAVLASREVAATGAAGVRATDPIAVLVQPVLDTAAGGVAFGVDPVTGRADRIVVSAAGSPGDVVSGARSGDRYELDDHGRVRSHEHADGGAVLRRRQLRALVELVLDAGATFGGPQDVEWGIDREGRLWLLQSRPVTTPIAGRPTGPVFGRGPVAETFPETLSPLEASLWVPPLRRALRTVLRMTAAASSADLARSPVVVCVDGVVAVDLELFGDAPRRERRWAAAVAGRVRKLRTAWRVGRLRAALPDLAADLVARTDEELLAVPAPRELDDHQLLAVLDRAAHALTAVHGHEAMIGLLVGGGTPRFTGAAVAARVLADARRAGLAEEDLVARQPVVLALAPPRVAPAPDLPDTDGATPWAPPRDGDRSALLREALRLRARWLQELGGRAAWALGERLAARGALERPDDVRQLTLDELRAITDGRAVQWQRRRAERPPASSVPARFRIGTRGRPIPVDDTSGEGPTGAGGGIGRGTVWKGEGAPPSRSVLVVSTLDPALAPHVGDLAGLVAETGSELAHVVILAREAGVPTVVGFAGAVERFPEGAPVRVDGTTGEVELEGDG